MKTTRTPQPTPVEQANDLALTELRAPAPNSLKVEPALVIPTLELPDARNIEIRELAYRLYEERGRTDGHGLEDWLEAELIISQGGKSAA